MKRKTPAKPSAETVDKALKPPTPAALRTSKGLLSVGVFSSKLTKPLLGKRGLGEGDLVARWPMIVGEAIAALTVPERIRFPRGSRENGELTIRVASGPAALQLQHDEPRLRERINGHFGYRAVAKVKLVQAPLPRPPRRPKPKPRPLTPAEERDLDGLLAGVTDPDLRATLERLGRAVRAKQPKA